MAGPSVLMKRFEVTREEILTVGDSDNDYEMVAHAGVGVAMGNAKETIQKAARHHYGFQHPVRGQPYSSQRHDQSGRCPGIRGAHAPHLLRHISEKL